MAGRWSQTFVTIPRVRRSAISRLRLLIGEPNGKCEECLRRLGEHGCLSAGSLFQGRNKGARVEAHFAVAIEKAAILRQCEKRSPVKNPPIGLVGGQWAYLSSTLAKI